MEGFRNEAWLALCVILSTALSCLPESEDLGAYAAEWSPAIGAGASAGSAGQPGLAGSVSEPVPDAGAGGGGDGVGVAEGLGGGELPLGGPDGVAAGESGGAAGESGVPTELAEACADGVLGPDQTRCYLVSSADAVWQSARDQCLAWQGALVRVDTAEEDRFLATLVSESQWLGASDTALDNIFVWTDGSPVGFGNWGPGQPDRFPGPDCVEKRAGPGRFWFDQPCANARAFVCEKAATLAP